MKRQRCARPSASSLSRVRQAYHFRGRRRLQPSPAADAVVPKEPRQATQHSANYLFSPRGLAAFDQAQCIQPAWLDAGSRLHDYTTIYTCLYVCPGVACDAHMRTVSASLKLSRFYDQCATVLQHAWLRCGAAARQLCTVVMSVLRQRRTCSHHCFAACDFELCVLCCHGLQFRELQ